MIAAVALFVVSAYLIGVKKPAKYTLYPAIFMLVTTVAAMAWQAYRFFAAPEPNLLLGSVSLLFIGLAIFVGSEGMKVIKAHQFKLLSEPSKA